LYIIQLFHTFQVSLWEQQNDSQITVLLGRSVQYIDPGTCRNIKPDEFDRYVTTDKFCSNFTQGNTNLDSDCRRDKRSN